MLVADEASELKGRELVAPGELDCVSVVSGGLEVVRRSLVELLGTWPVEDDSRLLSGLKLVFWLSDSLLPLLVCSSEDADDARLLASAVLASDVEKGSLVVLSSWPDEEIGSDSLDCEEARSVEALLNSSLDNELNGVILGWEVISSVEMVLDSSTEEVDGTSLSWVVLKIDVDSLTVLLASVELSSTVEDVKSTPLVEELSSSLVGREDPVISWLLRLDASTVLVENPDSVAVDVVSSLLLIPETLDGDSVELSRLLG